MIFNEEKFANYLFDLTKNFKNPSNNYDQGAYDTLVRICREFEHDHHSEDVTKIN